MRKNRVQRAFSAGGVIFRVVPATPAGSGAQPTDAAEAPAAEPPKAPAAGLAPQIEIVLVGRRYSGIWALPKGTPRKGEKVAQVALREVREETGLHTRILASLGSVHYSFIYNAIRYEKEVRYFLMEPVGGDLSLHDAEYDEVRWFPLPEAYQRLTYETDSQIVRRAEEHIQRRLSARSTSRTPPAHSRPPAQSPRPARPHPATRPSRAQHPTSPKRPQRPKRPRRSKARHQ